MLHKDDRDVSVAKALTTFTVLVILTLSGLSIAVAQEPPAQASVGWTMSQRRQALDDAERALDAYFYSDRIAALRGVIEADRKWLLQISDQKAFAKALTTALQNASGDKHIIVWFSDRPTNGTSSPANDAASEQRFFAHIGYGFDCTARLTGNIGYLKLGGFADMPGAKATLDAAMTLVSSTDALIVDLRGNGGGDSDTVAYLLGYFFAHPTEITGAIVREHGTFHTDRDFTPATVGSRKYLSKPLYVLIDRQTISAGEMFAYDLKTLHRAMVLGEASAGAAMGLGSPPFPLTEHLSISVPNAETRNPYTGTNWDGTGVIPDVALSSKETLLAAYERALAAANERYDPTNELPGTMQDPAAALRASFPSMPASP